MSTIPETEHSLKIARERLDQAVRALAPKHRGGEWEEYETANQAVLLLERQLASLKGDEFAEPVEFPVKWDVGAPMPHLFVNDYRALLSFLISEPDPNWDGTSVRITDPRSSEAEPLALVEFEGSRSAKLGAPNDEVFDGHPLSGKGLESYRAQRVVNSRWLKELEAINSVHRMYQPETWRDLHHFVFWFHDTTFECVARSFQVETYRESLKEMLGRMLSRLIA
jgi:hypothetical protein